MGLGASWAVVTLVEQIPMEGEFFEVVGRPLPVLSFEVALVVVALTVVVPQLRHRG